MVADFYDEAMCNDFAELHPVGHLGSEYLEGLFTAKGDETNGK